MQNPEKILRSLGRHVHKGGEVIFVDFDKFFYVIPNVKWIESDSELVNLFAKAGFKVHVERKRGLLQYP